FSGGSQNETPIEEFDFSGGLQNETPIEDFDLGGKTEENVITNELKQENEEVLSPQPYSEYANNSVPLQAKPYTDMYGTPPQIIGYDQNGMPVYAQPQMYPQSQFIGYDQNGMPIYAQSQMYPQSQFMGYDQNGMPIYSQPMVFQPQIIGYDQNGMPVYSQPVSYPQSQVMNYAPPSVNAEKVQQQPVDEEMEKFRDFLDDGKNETATIQKEEDFFGKSSDMGDVALPDLDIGGLKKREKKKKVYMTDVEIQDAENLVPNNASKFNQKYMRKANEAGSGDLGEKTTHKKRVEMSETKTADPRLLNPKFQYKSRIKMGDTTTAQTDNFNTKTLRQRKVSMAEADHAVEAMPKKKKYVDELDLIELPEYMQARKKSKKDKPDFPSMSDL
ncbi:MAG: hypothetical protein K2J32_03120, partial [Ruminococcus sp.]|nr:hypothetical protein [Ruminococcus sp.]